MRRREISRERYVAAGVITTFVFLLGIVIGIMADLHKIRYAERISERQDVDFESLQLQYLYLQYLENGQMCPVISKVLENNLRTLQPVLEKLVEYEERNEKNSEDYEILKRKYLIYNIRYYILAKKSREDCNADIVTILYFYSRDCEICPNQGFILSHLKSILKDRLLVFPIDADYEAEPMVNVLSAQYNVTVYPTLIIWDRKVEGYRTEKEVLEEICPFYRIKPDICKGVRG